MDVADAIVAQVFMFPSTTLGYGAGTDITNQVGLYRAKLSANEFTPTKYIDMICIKSHACESRASICMYLCQVQMLNYCSRQICIPAKRLVNDPVNKWTAHVITYKIIRFCFRNSHMLFLNGPFGFDGGVWNSYSDIFCQKGVFRKMIFPLMCAGMAFMFSETCKQTIAINVASLPVEHKAHKNAHVLWIALRYYDACAMQRCHIRNARRISVSATFDSWSHHSRPKRTSMGLLPDT